MPLFAFVLSCAAACGSAAEPVGGTSMPPPPDAAAEDSPSETQASGAGDDATCGAIVSLPAILTVVAADGQSLVCDATISVLQDGGAYPPDGGTAALPCNAGMPYGCPTLDGGAAPCSYALLGAPDPTSVPSSYTVLVSQPGYAPVVATNVSTGVSGCVPTIPATHITVTLMPIVDAAADG